MTQLQELELLKVDIATADQLRFLVISETTPRGIQGPIMQSAGLIRWWASALSQLFLRQGSSLEFVK